MMDPRACYHAWRRRRRETEAPATPLPVDAAALVPLAHMRDEAPPGDYRIASRYLMPESRMKRRETSFRPHLAEVGARQIEVDFSLPAHDCEACVWYVPAALLPKGSVAPALQVTDACGTVLAAPTKRENMALTERAIEELSEHRGLTLRHPTESREVIREVISREPLDARISRLVLFDHEPAAGAELGSLLGLLEDHFILWVAVHGAPESAHHVTISRHEYPGQRQNTRRLTREVVIPFETALGAGQASAGLEVGPRLPDPEVALENLLLAFAVRPLELVTSEIEPRRFASAHLRVQCPNGFLVRQIRAGAPAGVDRQGRARIVELDPADPHVTVQGVDQDLGHMHLSQIENPGEVYVRLTLALRGGTTALWMLAALLTAGLLWLVHHHYSYGPPIDQNKQIAAAVLLVGPAFASAWSLRAEGSELLRTTLAGARFLLLATAALSVASALALAGVFPSGSNRYETIEVYASASYLVAVPLLFAWLLSLRPTWIVFRSVLSTRRRNLIACAVIGVIIACLGLHHGIGGRLLGLSMVLVGLALASVAANPIGESLQRDRTLYRPLAGIASPCAVLIGGYFLGFYADVINQDSARTICFCLGAALLVATGLAVAFIRLGIGEE